MNSSTCPSGKVQYFTRKNAKHRSRILAGQGRDGLRPYECPDCGMWHLGHKPKVTMQGRESAQSFHARCRA